MDLNNIPATCLHHVRHHQQKSNWDCGVSCVVMVLSHNETHSKHLHENLEDVCKSQGFGHSTWTIDLCYLLKHYGLAFRYSTVTVGVDPGYAKQVFYSKILQRDMHRVVDRFGNASDNDIAVEERSVDISEVLCHVARQGPCIVLTNSNLLCCDKCQVSSRLCGSNIHSCLRRHCATTYQGHYIVVVGYDMNEKKIIYRNPTLRDRECWMSFECFDEARTSYGTDEDIIFIFNS